MAPSRPSSLGSYLQIFLCFALLSFIVLLEVQHRQDTLEIATQLKDQLDGMRRTSEQANSAYSLSRRLENHLESNSRWPLAAVTLVILAFNIRNRPKADWETKLKSGFVNFWTWRP